MMDGRKSMANQNKNNGVSILGTIKKLTKAREFMVFLIVIAVTLIMAFASPVFLDGANMRALFMGIAVTSIVACGMTLVIINGGIDLSVGSTVALTGAVTAYCIKAGVPMFIAIAAGFAVGLLVGLINGLMIARLGINAFIITLGMMNVARGLTLLTVGGLNIANLPESFTVFGQGKLWGLQYPIIVMIILVIIGDILLRKSRYFRQNYYIGNNEKAAELSGINVKKTKIINFVISGGLCALAGILLTSRLASATATAGNGLEMRVITAVILGGASLNGGQGTILGTFFGALLMGLIADALTLLSVDVNWQTFILGGVLLLAVVIDNFKNKKSTNA